MKGKTVFALQTPAARPQTALAMPSCLHTAEISPRMADVYSIVAANGRGIVDANLEAGTVSHNSISFPKQNQWTPSGAPLT